MTLPQYLALAWLGTPAYVAAVVWWEVRRFEKWRKEIEL